MTIPDGFRFWKMMVLLLTLGISSSNLMSQTSDRRSYGLSLDDSTQQCKEEETDTDG